MTLSTLLKDALNAKFENAKIPGAGSMAPRDGYYFIRDVKYYDFGLLSTVPIAIVNWKANEKDSYFEDITFKIALLNITPTGNDFNHFIGNEIVVYNSKMKPVKLGQKEQLMVSAEWAVVGNNPKFIKSQFAAIQSLRGGSENLNEAYKRVEVNLGLDFSASLDWEAMGGDVYDAPEDNFEPNDGPADDVV